MAKAKTIAEANPLAWLNAARSIGAQRGGFLSGTEATYRMAVEALATVLKPRLVAGEVAPVARECRRLFVTSESSAFVVMTWSSSQARKRAGWGRVMPAAPLDLVAAEAMAHDVVAYARRAGWLRSGRGRVAA